MTFENMTLNSNASRTQIITGFNKSD